MAARIRQADVYRYALMGVLIFILSAFLLWPIFLTVSGGFRDPAGGFTLKYIASVFSDPVWMAGLGNSLAIAFCTTLVCLVITLPMAVLSARFTFPGKAILTSVVLVPLILPPFVGAIGMRQMLGQYGAINSFLAWIGILEPGKPGIDFLGGAGVGGQFWAIVIMEALHLYPILYLNVTAALANLDPALDEAAIGLGASWKRRFFQITLPLIVPGIFAGATIVFIWSFTELGTPLMFDYYTVTPVQIYWGIQEVATNPRPYALVVVMLAVAIVLYILGKLALGGRAHEMQSKASIQATPKQLTGPVGVLAALLFLGVTSLAVMPHIGVILASFSVEGTWYQTILPAKWTDNHYQHALSHPLVMHSIRNSLMLASIAMLGSMVMGLAVSYLVVRVKVKGAWLLDALSMLPLAVPGLVMAFGYVAMSLSWPFGKGQPLAGWFDIVGSNPNPIPLLIIAYAVRRLPYVVRSASAGLEQTSGQLEEAALNLGASTMTTIRRIVVPLIMANMIAGGILAFSFAMLEVSDSLILAQKEQHFPLTKAIFELFNRLGDGPYVASALGVWAMVLLTVTLVGASVLLGKKMGAIFRA